MSVSVTFHTYSLCNFFIFSFPSSFLVLPSSYLSCWYPSSPLSSLGFHALCMLIYIYNLYTYITWFYIWEKTWGISFLPLPPLFPHLAFSPTYFDFLIIYMHKYIDIVLNVDTAYERNVYLSDSGLIHLIWRFQVPPVSLKNHILSLLWDVLKIAILVCSKIGSKAQTKKLASERMDILIQISPWFIKGPDSYTLYSPCLHKL